MINPRNILTITAFDLLLDEKVSANFSKLITDIEQCATYGEIATLMDAWLQDNPAIEDQYNPILLRLEQGEERENSRFFQGIKKNPQNPESVHREMITLLTNKIRERSVPNPSNPQPPQAHDRP
jgi:hypothetical protein